MDPISTNANTQKLTEKDEVEMHRDRIVREALRRRKGTKNRVYHKKAEDVEKFPALAKAAGLEVPTNHAANAPGVPNRSADYPGGRREPQGHEVPGSGQGPMHSIWGSQHGSVPAESPVMSSTHTGGNPGLVSAMEVQAAAFPSLAKAANYGQPGSGMAVTAVGDKRPGHSNAVAAPPSVANGGVTSYGQDAWSSIAGYMPSAAPQATMADAGIGEAAKPDKKQEHGDAGMTVTAAAEDPKIVSFFADCQREGLSPQEISERIMKSAAEDPEMNDRWVSLYDNLIGSTLLFN